MTARAGLRLVADAAHDAEPAAVAGAAAPQLFVRAFTAPAGLPWDQARMADLDARLGAPLPPAELAWRLRRLEPWRPGRPCRYAAVYVRAGDVGAGFAAEPEIDGAPVKVRFFSPAETRRRLRHGGLAAAAVAAVVAAALGVSLSVVSVRGQADERLEAAEAKAALQLRRAEKRERLATQARALATTGVDGRRLHDLLEDVAWASRARAPDARVEALHWDHGYMAVEVRGDTAPFPTGAGRTVEQAKRPVRPGVRLWGVGPGAASAPAGSAGR